MRATSCKLQFYTPTHRFNTKQECYLQRNQRPHHKHERQPRLQKPRQWSLQRCRAPRAQALPQCQPPARPPRMPTHSASRGSPLHPPDTARTRRPAPGAGRPRMRCSETTPAAGRALSPGRSIGAGRGAAQVGQQLRDQAALQVCGQQPRRQRAQRPARLCPGSRVCSLTGTGTAEMHSKAVKGKRVAMRLRTHDAAPAEIWHPHAICFCDALVVHLHVGHHCASCHLCRLVNHQRGASR